MALADRYEQGTRKAVESGYYEFGPEFQREREMIVSALRLAASQPDRDVLATAVRGALVENWKDDFGAAWNEDVLLTGCRRVGGGRGYQKPEEAAQNLALDAADKILSLLSGAGAKSDGGVEGHARMDACGLSDDSLRGGANSSNERGGAGIKPGPSDPSPGPDVKPAPIADSSEAGTSGVDLEKRVADLMWAIGAKDKQILELSAALSAPVGEPVAWQYRLFANGYWLGWCICSKTQARHYRGQRDVEIRPLYTHPPAPAVGPDVREALGESSQTLEYLRREARTWGKIFSVNVDHVLDKNRKALSALTRPLGGFVQGSIARKQSTDTEGSSRTETAGGAG